jgi:tRNA G18 (ribose-2'-O)-methylase SpoU
MKLKARELRKTVAKEENYKKIKRNPIYLVLDNVIDTYNIGSLFRLADAIAAKKLFICGDSEYPPSSRIHKAAVGTEAWVPWQKENSALEVVNKLKKEGYFIVSAEQSRSSLDYKHLNKENIRFPLALVVGNETEGVSKNILEKSDLVVELPMYGINHSFNVWGTASVILYKILEFI